MDYFMEVMKDQWLLALMAVELALKAIFWETSFCRCLARDPIQEGIAYIPTVGASGGTNTTREAVHAWMLLRVIPSTNTIESNPI